MAPDQHRGVCRVEVAKVDWDHLSPWQKTAQMRSTGTAFVIEGRRLLTNAHVVKSAIDIRGRPHGSTRRFPAKVVTYAPDVDLALRYSLPANMPRGAVRLCGEQLAIVASPWLIKSSPPVRTPADVASARTVGVGGLPTTRRAR